jgi:uncharacterized membrane protein
LLLVGTSSKVAARKKINMAFGYRTNMSMKNEDTWKFAHKHCGKTWWIVGWVLLPVSIAAMFFVLGKDVDTVGLFGGILCAVQVIFLVGSIIPTERALRKHFDKNGNRKPDTSPL